MSRMVEAPIVIVEWLCIVVTAPKIVKAHLCAIFKSRGNV